MKFNLRYILISIFIASICLVNFSSCIKKDVENTTAENTTVEYTTENRNIIQKDDMPSKSTSISIDSELYQEGLDFNEEIKLELELGNIQYNKNIGYKKDDYNKTLLITLDGNELEYYYDTNINTFVYSINAYTLYCNYYNTYLILSEYIKNHEDKYKGYKITIEYFTGSNMSNMYLYNYNVDTSEYYNNVYDFNYMELGFYPFLGVPKYDIEGILNESVFSNIEDIYLNDFFTVSLDDEKTLYFLNSMINLNTFKVFFNWNDEECSVWLNYIEKTHPNCEIIYKE